jgi:xanthine dehydrogenase YagS FAD-binding subunit
VKPFAYTRARETSEAVALVSAAPARDGAAMFLGGGTNLVDLMRLGVEAPEALVDVTRLGLDTVESTADDGLRIGASVRNSDLASNRLVRDRYPVLSSALLQGASGQLRNLATTAGNLLQRTRCMYFQDVTKRCNKRSPGTGCPAREGEHSNLAIIGHSEHCVATHPSDMAVALAALDAVVHLTGPAGERTIPLLELHRLPDDEPQRDTTLEPGELILAVELPPLPAARGSVYVKVRERASYSFAVVSIAAALQVDGGRVAEARVALGGVAHKPWRAHALEAAVTGRAATEADFDAAAQAELAEARPLRDNAYKVALARNLIVDTLTQLATAAGAT